MPESANRGYERAHGGREGAKRSRESANSGSGRVLEDVRLCKSHKIVLVGVVLYVDKYRLWKC